jgi:uncharacterized protein YceH (UPF0502 family)
MCVLLLRGSQTPGELRGNGSRLYEFSGLEEVEQTLSGLMAREPEPLVVRLPRQSGQKEVRFAHLLSGEIDLESLAKATDSSPETSSRRGNSERIDKLEEQVEHLMKAVEELQQTFEAFRKQFE